MVTPPFDTQNPAPPLPPIPEVSVRDQLLHAYRILATWQPNDPIAGVRWAAGVMEAQHVTQLSRYWHSGDPVDLHAPWGIHCLDGGRLFEYDQRAAWVDDQEVVLVRVTWDEVAALLDPVDPRLRRLVEEVAAVRDAFAATGARDEIWYDVRQTIQRRSFAAAAAVWDAVRPGGLPALTALGGGRHG